MLTLRNWKQRRNDSRVKRHWDRIAENRELNGFEQYQREWNFIETDYSDRPSNNGLDPANPSFAFSTKLAKYIVVDTTP